MANITMRIWETIFKSNNIKDCVDEIKLIHARNKYNL